jgi:Xaa-Pro dipeptidase
MISVRFEKLQKAIIDFGFDGVILNPGASLEYLTGLSFHLMERPVILLFVPGKKPALILPELEKVKLEACPIEFTAAFFGDNPAERTVAFRNALTGFDLNGKKIAVEPTRLRFLEMEYLRETTPQAKFVDGSAVFHRLRLHKDAQEITAMRKAVDIAQVAFQKLIPFIHIGKTEHELANRLTSLLLEGGSDPELPFQVILSSGPNSANPHAEPSERKLQTGDLVVVDWGASYQGYASDLTRTLVMGDPNSEQKAIAASVLRANQAGRAAGKPGIAAGDVDRAARAEIERDGFGKYFTHRTGHGLGMEAHEAPYMFAENLEHLEAGMVYTVEPGIYLPGKGGVRIEDDVVATTDGSETLSDLPRELVVIS